VEVGATEVEDAATISVLVKVVEVGAREVEDATTISVLVKMVEIVAVAVAVVANVVGSTVSLRRSAPAGNLRDDT
jgi:uncharacterized membrane protein